MTTGRSRSLGPDARPVAVPEDVGDPRLVKASGLVQLPLWVEWSGEKPLTYVVADQWDVLVLPPRVRRAWADWFRRRGITLSC